MSYDGVEIVILRLPSERGPDAGTVGDDGRRIPGPARRMTHRELFGAHPFDRCDDFADRITMSVTTVEYLLRASPAQIQKRGQMRCREIGHMDVIANAGAVRRVVVRAVDLDQRPYAQRSLDRDLDEMRCAQCCLSGPQRRV